MLDINLFRDDKSREIIRESEKKKFKNFHIVDEIYELDKERIITLYKLEQTNKKMNDIQNEIKKTILIIKKDKIDLNDKINNLKLSKEEPKQIQIELQAKIVELNDKIIRLLHSVGNIISNDVPVFKTEEGNITVRLYNSDRNINAEKGYAEIMSNFTNAESGANLIGHRGYFLEGKMALLARALENYAIDFLIEKGYTLIQVPVMMRKEVMGLTSQLSDFDDQLYKVEDDMYLIATSEQPLTSLYMNKKLSKCELPKYYAGESLCFRKEAGAYGKDNAGIFRVHQFNKIEQFIICCPEDSNEILEKLIKTSEEFYKSLGLSFRVVLVSSGELNDAAVKKYDLEAYFPFMNKYRELVSASNCTDYQSRNLNVGFGYPKPDEKQIYVHMLNATLCAVQRTLCCIVENYQNGSLIEIPKVLKSYLKFDVI